MKILELWNYMEEIMNRNNGIKHKVFISYHHANDQWDKDKFDKLFSEKFDIIINKSIKDGDIDNDLKAGTIWRKIRDEYLRDSTVTIVLIGKDTWKRKYVDWEIASSLRDTQLNKRSGLIGIVLPDHPNFKEKNYDIYTMPPRLADNLENGFGKIYDWSDNPESVYQWIEDAFNRKDKITPSNGRDTFVNNRDKNKVSWKE